MLDTNLLVNFLLIQWKEDKKQKIPEQLKKSKELKEKYIQKKFVNYVSDWNLLEFRDAVEKLIHEKKLINNGYSINEFKEGREELPLNQSELDKINKIVSEVYGNSIFIVRPINYKKLIPICQKGVSTFDALLLIQANSIKECNKFVTRDKQLIKKFKEKLTNDLPNIDVISRGEALQLINNQIYHK